MSVSNFIQWVLTNQHPFVLGVMALIATVSAVIKALEALVAILVTAFPALKGVDGELVSIAAFLDSIASSSILNLLALSPKKRGDKQLAAQSSKLLLVLALVGVSLQASPARAQGFDYSVGPTIPLTEIDFNSKTPVQLAPGAGLQFSLTHDSLKKDILGKSYDLLDLTGMAFGSVVTGASGQQFGALSIAAGAGFMSSLVFVGVGTHVLSGSQALAPGQPFLLFALNFNIAIGPTAPPVGIAKGAAGLVRGNTLYLSGP